MKPGIDSDPGLTRRLHALLTAPMSGSSPHGSLRGTRLSVPLHRLASMTATTTTRSRRLTAKQRAEVAKGLVARTEERRTKTSGVIPEKHRASLGQFFTPSQVAVHLASLFDLPAKDHWRLLDPGAGVGSLTAAVIADAIAHGCTGSIGVTAFELDEGLIEALNETMADCVDTASRAGIQVTAEVVNADFLEWVASHDYLGATDVPRYDFVITNPPYKKVDSRSRTRKLTEMVGCGSPNLYTAFISMALRVMNDGGQLVAITPRSFANGPYFLPFREDLLSRTSLRHVHVFESRSSAFADTDVLQENVIWRADVGAPRGPVVIAHSEAPGEPISAREVPHVEVVSESDPQRFLHFRLDEAADDVAARMAAMACSVTDLGMTVSTGMVVDFRSRDCLTDQRTSETAPMVYPAHLKEGRSHWPAGATKPSHYIVNPASERDLLPEGWYVVVKRFSAKEEKRRVVAAVWDPTAVPGPVAFDNKTNVFHIRKSGLDRDLARGLAAYLNSTFLDDAFRQFSGHTQVNATDLRGLRYPSDAQLRWMGQRLTDGVAWGESLDDLLTEATSRER